MGIVVNAIITCATCGGTGTCPIVLSPMGVPAVGAVVPASGVSVGNASYPTGWMAMNAPGNPPSTNFYCPGHATGLPAPASPGAGKSGAPGPIGPIQVTDPLFAPTGASGATGP